MIKLSPVYLLRTTALLTLVGSLSFVAPVNAAPEDTSEPPRDQAGEPPSQPPAYQTPGQHGKSHNHRHVYMHVEDRIKMLHSKLAITPDQEPKWTKVADVIRSNEKDTYKLIEQRHQDPENMTAIDDLQSYQKITQAHADDLQKLIPPFESLYDDMSADQKQKADEVFGHMEGHHGDKMGKMNR